MSEPAGSGRTIADVTHQALGVKFPEMKLADGTVVQTGTFGALMTNITKYNEAHAAGNEQDMKDLRHAMSLAMPLMDRVGLFKLFTPEEWLAGNNEGRKTVGQVYLHWKASTT